MRTNPYFKNYSKPSASCFDVTKTPLIYDYGGRPVTTTGLYDLFKNSGSGTAALGTDCSGFVYMAVTSAGLRVKKGTAIKPSLIAGATSSQFTNPQKNGLTCFDYVKFSGRDSLRAGDVVAKNGHVFLPARRGLDLERVPEGFLLPDQPKIPARCFQNRARRGFHVRPQPIPHHRTRQRERSGARGRARGYG